MKLFLMLLTLTTADYCLAKTENQTNIDPKKNKLEKEEVLDNPTLKTLSGSLRKYSLYSSFTYRGASLEKPFGAERPNILNAQEKPGLVDMSGNLGIKYRASKADNFSLQLGLYSTTPFHNSIETENQKNQEAFDANGQQVDADDPVFSYFKTYYLGSFQNVSFFQYQYVTRGIYRDFGLHSAFSFSHATAYRINKAFYIAASISYQNFQYDKTSVNIGGRDYSLATRQTDDTLKANLSTEFYLKRNVSFRYIMDIASYYRMRWQSEIENRDFQQTLAMTYFFNRDVSISPNIRFVTTDIRDDRTNIGLSLNLNI